MRTIGWTMSVAALVLAANGTPRADEGSSPKAIVEKAIKATGGAELLQKYKGLSIKAKSQFFGTGDAIDLNVDQYIQLPDKMRLDIKSDAFNMVQVIDGDKGWVVQGGEVKEMDKNMLKEVHEEMYARSLTHLLPLLEEGCKLTALPEVTVAGKPAVGIRVEHKGHRDASLYFDKDSGLLVRMDRRAKDMQAGNEVNAESIFEDYKKVEGVQIPFKIIAKRDGKRFIETEVQEAKAAEKLDEKLFEKPSGD